MCGSPRIDGWAPCWNGQALTLDSSTRWPQRSRDAGARVVCAHHKHSKMALCATSSFTLGEVTAPWCYYQAKVFHELNVSSVELLQSFFLCCHSIPFNASPLAISTATRDRISVAGCTFCCARVLACRICSAALMLHESILCEALIVSVF